MVPPFTIGKMVSFGIVRFKTLQHKTKFKEWLGTNQHRVKALKIWVNDNIEKERREKEIIVGKVKKALCLNKEGRTDVICDWRWGRVYVGRELVATWEQDTLKLVKGEVLDLGQQIQELCLGVGMSSLKIEKATQE